MSSRALTADEKIKSNAEYDKKKLPCLPVRHMLAIMGFLGFCNVYALRVNLNVAIVAMVKEPVITDVAESTGELACPELMDYNTYYNFSDLPNATYETREFDWDSKMQGLVLGSFYYGYILTQIPGGMLAEKYGPKLVFGVGVLITAILSLFTAVAARWSVWALVAVRVLEGFAEGVTCPAMNVLVARWAPTSERSRLSALVCTGCSVGTVLSMAATGVLCQSYAGWPAAFYVFGSVACVWFVLWVYLVHDSPQTHPKITQEELLHIVEDQNGALLTDRPVPWKAILTSIPMWALTLAHFGQNWGFYTLLSDTPTYLANILHYNLEQNGILSAVPHLIHTFLAIASCACADKVRERGLLGVTTIRKICNSIAFYGPGICLLIVAYSGCQPAAIVSLLTLATALIAFEYCGFYITHVDMSPEFAGTLMGITNGFANLSGFMAPAFVGWMVHEGQTVENWRIVFITSAAIYFVTGTIYNIFCTAELQDWDSSTQTAKQINNQKSKKRKQMKATKF